jgi:hypothetical protein
MRAQRASKEGRGRACRGARIEGGAGALRAGPARGRGIPTGGLALAPGGAEPGPRSRARL